MEIFNDFICNSSCVSPVAKSLHIDENACDGFAKNCNVTGRINEELFREEIGDLVYLVVNYYQGRVLYHIREYDIDQDGVHFPTKHGIVFDLEKWMAFQSTYVQRINACIGKYKNSNDEKTVLLNIDLGWRQFAESVMYNRVKKLAEIIIMKKKFMQPSSYGVSLSFKQWDNLLLLAKSLPTFE